MAATVSHSPDTCVALLQRMIAVDTENRIHEGVSFVEGPLAEEVESMARSWGMECRRLEIPGVGFNLLITVEANPQAPWLLFDSHLDTVSKDGMTVDPLGGSISDGRIYGRGSCDTKGTGAAMLWALKELVASAAATTNIAILFSIEEEVSKTGIRAFAEQQLPTLGWRPLGAIVGEATQLRIVSAHNGSVRWDIETSGVTAHSSRPELGRSAISAMVGVIQAIEHEYASRIDAHHELVGTAACSINTVHGGTHINVIPDSCRISIDRRVVPGEDPAGVLPAVEQVLDRLRGADPKLEVRQHPAKIDPPLSPDSSTALVASVGEVLASMNLAPQPVGVAYGTHASNLSLAGVPSIVLGPGDIAKAHTADEFLELEQLQRGVEVYGAIMKQPPERWISA